MKKFILFLALTLWVLKGYTQQTRVLFIGNSYTGVNDLPGMFYQLSLSLGDTVIYDSNSPGGYTFNMHSTNSTTLQKIALPGWDFVVLQAQSQEPSFSPAQVATDTYPYAAKLDSLVHAANTCAYTMFYMTWGRKYGDASNCAFYPPVCTFNGMNERLRASYLQMGTDNFSRVSPVGVAWKNAWFADSTINLWSGDNSHPSIAGTYLTACVFYASIFKQSPVGASYTAGLTIPQASFLQSIAQQTVFDSLDTWMLNQDPINAAYTDTIFQNLAEFYFTGYNADQFWWDFGDGIGYSTLKDPTYFYTNPGNYEVQLIASNGCFYDTVVTNVTITSVGIEEELIKEGRVFPNPSSYYLYTSQDCIQKQFSIRNVHGMIVLQGEVSSKGIDVSILQQGVYFLAIENSTQKIVIE